MVSRIALSPEQKRYYMVNDLPYWFEKEAKKKGLHTKDLAASLEITPQSWNGRKKKMVNGKPKDSFSYGDMLILFRLLGTSEEEKLKLLAL